MFNREGAQATGHSSSFPWSSTSEGVPPRWKDRFFSDHKSRDQVIQQLRDELDRQRKMFFERAAHPQWNSAEQRGFPFKETARRFADRAGFPTPFDDDAEVWAEEGGRQRHPSGGSCRTTSSKSSTGSNQSSSGGEDPPCSTSSPKFRKAATRSATGEFPVAAATSASAPRGFRASSAPPPPTSSSPRRFTSTMKVPMNESAEVKEQQQQQPRPSPPTPHQQHHQQQQNAHGNVRQIPIFVEGRDEPVLAKLDEEDRSQDSDTDKSDAVDHTKPIPMPFHQSQDPASAKPIPLPFHTEANQEPIPLPYHQDPEPKPDPVNETAPGAANCPETEAQVSMSQIDSIRREAEFLMPRIESFKGSRGDREFLFLDEMLTRLLLKLDLIPVEGRDDVRQSRKEAIGSIQRCINLLESKCCPAAGSTTNQDPGESDSGISELKDNSDASEASSSEPIALGYSHI